MICAACATVGNADLCWEENVTQKGTVLSSERAWGKPRAKLRKVSI